MIVTRRPKTRRLNVAVDDALVACLSSIAQDECMTRSAFVRRAIERECARAREEALAKAAESLAPLYRSDEELTAFTALDGEDFA